MRRRKNRYLTLDGFMERFSTSERAEIEANARRLHALRRGASSRRKRAVRNPGRRKM